MGRLRSMHKAAWIILAIALLIRVAVAFGGTHHFGPNVDSGDYDRYARSIAFEHSYPPSTLAADGGPTAFRPPGYPVFLAAVYALPGPDVRAGLLAQALLGTIVVGLIGVLARQLWSRRTALVSMGIAAVCPPLIVLGASLLSEPLFLVFELAAVAAVVEHRRSRHRFRWAVAAAVLVALATLTRINGAWLAIPLAIALWTATPAFSRRTLMAPAAFAVVAALVITPWVVRNAVALHAFIPFSTQPDIALARNYNAVAMNDRAHPGVAENSPELLAIVRRPGLSEAAVAHEVGSDARAFMRRHPGYVAQTLLRNTARLLHVADARIGVPYAKGEGVDGWLANLGVDAAYLLELLALAGILVPAARRVPWFVWVAPLIALLPSLVMAAGRTRYRAPIDPFIVILAAIAVVWAWERIAERRSSEPQPASSPAP